MDLAEALSDHNDVTIYAEPTMDPMVCPVPVRPLDQSSLKELQQCDRLVTVLGNSWLHGGALKVARSSPSIVILHDVMLAGLFLSTVPRPELEEVLTRYYGSAATSNALRSVDTGHSVWEGGEALRMPLFEAAIEKARGVVVHSQFAADLVRACTIAPVTVIPLAFRNPHSADNEPSETPNSPYVLTLGHANANKCHEMVMDALARLDMPEVRYVIAGSITPDRRATLAKHAIQVGVTDQVVMTGQISDTHVAALVRRAALCVNLRKPTFESGSASLLEQMEAGKPVVVFDHGCYSDVPEEVAIKIPTDSDADSLAAVLRAYLLDDPRLSSIGQRASAYVAANHSFDLYARQLTEFFDVVDAADPLTRLAASVASLTSEWNMPTGSGLPLRWAESIGSILGMSSVSRFNEP